MTNKMAATRDRLRLGVVPLATLRTEALRIDAKILAARGLTRTEIANELGVDERSVRRWLA